LFNQEEFYQLLIAKQYPQAWEMYDVGLTQQEINRKFDNIPRWNGSDLSGKNILVWAEQGVGDQIMFGTMLKSLLVNNKPMNLVLELDHRLIPLFERSFNRYSNLSFVPFKKWSISDKYFDYQISMGSLPRYLRTTEEMFLENRAPYLIAKNVNKKRLEYNNLSTGWERGKPTIGISWSTQNKNQDRSIHISLFDKMVNTDKYFFVNLDTSRLEQNKIYLDKSINQMKNLDDFATQVAACDLVISIDNTTAHMAGGLGVQTWLLLNQKPDWRWLEDTSDTLWYRNVDVLRRRLNTAVSGVDILRRQDDWGTVFKFMEEKLLNEI
tara:strand:- start:92 stop:1063 length:972 start_codon:yes stop_codon:yes gene_type:complete